MRDGYVKLHRKMTEWGWYKNSNTKAVFLHLLLTASWCDTTFMGHTILRGQCVFGRKEAAAALGISEQSVRTAIKHLKSTGEITIKSTSKFSIITIVKYSNYQDVIGESNQQNNQPANQQSTSNQPATNHIKENKNNKNYIPPISPKGELDKLFSQFWKCYPKKVGKASAEKAFRKLKPSADLLQTILATLNAQKQTDQWQRDGGQYIPYPATWLNGRRWEDETPDTPINPPDHMKGVPRL